MTFEDARNLPIGTKITHSYFDKNEWMTINGEFITFEDGCSCSIIDYLSYRVVYGWADNYSIWEETK